MRAAGSIGKRLICSFSVLCLPQNKHVNNKLDNGAYYKNVTSTFVWRPFIICDEILLNGTIFFVLGTIQTKHIVLNGNVFFLNLAQISEKNIQ